MMLEEQKTKCKRCGIEFKFFSGFEHYSVMENHLHTPLCSRCSEEVKEFIQSKICRESCPVHCPNY